jgi:hypothetical protein
VPRTLYQLLGVEPTATRAEIDAALARRESQYRDLVRARKHPNQRIIERIRNAYETLVDPEKRAAYDRALARAAKRAAASTPRSRTSWPTTGAGARAKAGENFVARAWAGDERLWKPFALTFIPLAVLVAGAASPAGQIAVTSLAGLAPWLPVALAGPLALLCVAGAVLLWRCAVNVERRILGHIARAVSILALAGVGFAFYAIVTGSSLRIVP